MKKSNEMKYADYMAATQRDDESVGTAELIAAYEQSKWPRRLPRTAEVIRYLMDQHGLTRADMIPILGTASRVSEVLRGKKSLSMTMVQRLRTRFGVPADILLPLPKGKPHRRTAAKRAA